MSRLGAATMAADDARGFLLAKLGELSEAVDVERKSVRAGLEFSWVRIRRRMAAVDEASHLLAAYEAAVGAALAERDSRG